MTKGKKFVTPYLRKIISPYLKNRFPQRLLKSHILLRISNIKMLQNLKNLLEIDFPEKQSSNSQDQSLRCGVCYAFRLGMSVPDQVCFCTRSFCFRLLLMLLVGRVRERYLQIIIYGRRCV